VPLAVSWVLLAGWLAIPYGPCDHAGQPSPRSPWMMDVDGEVGQQQQQLGGGHASCMVHCTVKKNPSLYSLLADRRGEERERERCHHG